MPNNRAHHNPAPLEWPAPAKINLFLRVTGKRADGYHELETLFQFLEFADTLRFEALDRPHLSRIDRHDFELPEEDLSIRAARLLQATFPRSGRAGRHHHPEQGNPPRQRSGRRQLERGDHVIGTQSSVATRPEPRPPGRPRIATGRGCTAIRTRTSGTGRRHWRSTRAMHPGATVALRLPAAGPCLPPTGFFPSHPRPRGKRHSRALRANNPQRPRSNHHSTLPRSSRSTGAVCGGTETPE